MDAEWVEVRGCSSLHEAAFFKSVLEAAAIESMIPDEYTIGIQSNIANVFGGFRVLVRRRDVARAREILEAGDRAAQK